MRPVDDAFFALLLLAWAVTAAVWFRPWLARYRRSAGLATAVGRVEAGSLAWVELKLRGLKTTLLLAATSLASGGWGLVEAAFGLDPSALAPFEDSALWRAGRRDEGALRAAALATFAAAVLVLRGKLHDVRVVPSPDAVRGGEG